jgi:two-component system response regulator DesR
MSNPTTGHRSASPNRRPGHNEPMSCPRSPARPIRMVLADDDARVRAAIIATVALEADLALVAAAAAPAALALAESTDPTVALVDLMLPDATAGLALVAALSQRPGCAVIAMSVQGGLRQAGLEAGAVAFAEKANGIDAILAAVRAAASPQRT